MGWGTGVDTGTISASRPPGTAPQGTVPQGTVPQGTVPQGTVPQGTVPQGTAPQGTASLALQYAGRADYLAGDQILAIGLGTYVTRTYEQRR
jgi:hypothetical protein